MSDDPAQRSPMRNLARFETAEVEAYRRDLPKHEVAALQPAARGRKRRGR
jgi:hypothetical protein